MWTNLKFKSDLSHRLSRICSHLLKTFSMENFMFCKMFVTEVTLPKIIPRTVLSSYSSYVSDLLSNRTKLEAWFSVVQNQSFRNDEINLLTQLKAFYEIFFIKGSIKMCQGP